MVVAAAIVIALVLAMGGDKGSSGAKGALEKLLNAAKSKDLETAQNLTCAPLHDQLTETPFVTTSKYKIGDAQENGDSATVPFTATVLGKEANYTASAQKQDGDWKICNIAEGGPGAQGGGAGGGGGGGVAVSSGSTQGAPEQTVQRLLQAGKDRDLQTAQDLTCEPLHSDVEQFPEISTFEVGSGTVNGSSAEVPFTVTAGGDSFDEVAELKQDGGTWKVCDLSDASSSGGGSSGLPTGEASAPDFPSDTPSEDGPSTFCVTPAGSTPFCIPPR